MGAEKLYLVAMIAGAIVLWALVPWTISSASFRPLSIGFAFAGLTLAFLLSAYWIAIVRQHVLSRLFYAVTNKRAIVCRRGRNWRFADRIYIVANPHYDSYPYALLPTRPYPSLQIGTLIDQNELQPFGAGLSHPGQPPSWGHLTVPVTFEQIADADAVLKLIRSCTR